MLLGEFALLPERMRSCRKSARCSVKKIRKSAFDKVSAYSFFVEWEGVKEKYCIETLNKSEALSLCANLRMKFKANVFQVDCRTGAEIKRIA